MVKSHKDEDDQPGGTNCESHERCMYAFLCCHIITCKLRRQGLQTNKKQVTTTKESEVTK